MHIRDWSTDVCCADLTAPRRKILSPEVQPGHQSADRQLARTACDEPQHALRQSRQYPRRKGAERACPPHRIAGARRRRLGPAARLFRSEEHTSELQSLMRNSYAVFCLTKKQLICKYMTVKHTQTQITHK